MPREGKNSGTGKSFKGAYDYYSHDKGAKTSERLEWSTALNCSTDNADFALYELIDTAKNAQQIQLDQTGKKSPHKVENSVYTFSLSWHTSEAPTKEDMLQAGHSALKSLGMENRQALILCHNDEKYSHIHIMVNRVDPKTGLVEHDKTTSKSKLKLSKWADNYERERGQNFCPERRENWIKREKGEYVKHTQDKQHREAKHTAQADFKQANFYRFNEEDKKQFHKLVALKKEVLKVRLKSLARQENFKGQWREHYQEKRADQRQQFTQNKKNAQKLKDVLSNKYGIYKANIYDQHGLTSRPFNYHAGQTAQQGKNGKTYLNPAPSKLIRDRKAKLSKSQEVKKKKVVEQVNAQFKERFEALMQGRYQRQDKTLSKDFTGKATDTKQRIKGAFKDKAEEKKSIKNAHQNAVKDHQSQKDTTANDNSQEKENPRTRNRSKERTRRKVRTRSRERQP